MAYNLSRNSRVFITTNLNTATGKVLTSGFHTGNTFELKVLDGFKFSQDTAQTTIQINEAGNTPIRGQRAFNTAVNPVDISFSTYIRPRFASTTTTADEKHLWNALFGFVGVEGSTFNEAGALVTNTSIAITATGITRSSTAVGTATMSGATLTGAVVGTYYNLKNLGVTNCSYWEGPAKLTSYSGGVAIWDYVTPPVAAGGLTIGAPAGATARIDRAAWSDYLSGTGRTTPIAQVTSAMSNKNQLLPIGFLFVVDNTTYAIHNAAMDGVTVDFGLDQIATAAWTAKGTELEQLASTITFSGATMTGGVTGTYQVPAADTAPYITNKLSTMTLQSNLYGSSDASNSTAYNVVLTGGSIQIANNITYVTPANLGQVNKAIGYFTGARAISGSVNAYLRTGTSGDVGQLLSAMLSNLSTAVETKYRLQVELGGSSNQVKVEFDMPGAVISVPSVDIQDVVSTTINFNAQATTNTTTAQTYNIENTNDLAIRYYSNAS